MFSFHVAGQILESAIAARAYAIGYPVLDPGLSRFLATSLVSGVIAFLFPTTCQSFKKLAASLFISKLFFKPVSLSLSKLN